jgi:transcriptional regulator with XRE-family HTH domain
MNSTQPKPKKLKNMSFDVMTFEQKIIANLRIVRKDKKITLDKIYKETGIHLARIESKNHNITLSTLKKLCDYLEIDAFDFLSKLVRA